MMRSFSRFLHICTKLIPPFVVFGITRKNPDGKRFQSSLVAIRVSLQELGGLFLKLGQLLSARPDFVGPELSSELRNLLDHEPPEAFSSIKKTVESEFKKDIGKLFKSFDEKPISTASIAQAHKAVLPNGKNVVVKVQKYRLMQSMQKDLVLFKYLAHILDGLIGSKGLQFTYIYEEFSAWIWDELDFAVEGRRADKFYKNMEGVEGITIPEVFWEYSTGKVLTLSLIEGLTLNEILGEMKKQHVETIYEVKLLYKIDPNVLLRRLVHALTKQIFVDKFFHGDLHPANIIIQKENELAFVDFGIIGTLDTQEQTKLLLTLLALVNNDPEAIIKVILSTTTEPLSPPQIKFLYQRFSRELHQLNEDSLGKISISHFIMLFFSLTRRFNILWSSGLILGAKSISQIDSVAHMIGAKESIIDLVKPELDTYIATALSTEISKDVIYKNIVELIDAGKRLPQTLEELERIINSGTIPNMQSLPVNQSSKTVFKTIAFAGLAIVVSIPIISLPAITSLPYSVFVTLAVPIVFFYVLRKISS